MIRRGGRIYFNSAPLRSLAIAPSSFQTVLSNFGFTKTRTLIARHRLDRFVHNSTR